MMCATNVNSHPQRQVIKHGLLMNQKQSISLWNGTTNIHQQEKCKTQQSGGKVMCSVSCKSSRVILLIFNSEQHVETLCKSQTCVYMTCLKWRFKDSFGPWRTWKSGPRSCHFHVIICKCNIRNKISFKILLQCIKMDIF
jgi:hypothetical protein